MVTIYQVYYPGINSRMIPKAVKSKKKKKSIIINLKLQNVKFGKTMDFLRLSHNSSSVPHVYKQVCNIGLQNHCIYGQARVL